MMNSSLLQLLVRWLVLAVGVTIATRVVPGIACDSHTSLLVVVLLLSFFNAILKPLLVLFTLPFIMLTMGLGMVVINALLFLFVGRLVEGFHVSGFLAAVGGALIVSVTNFVASQLFRRPPKPPRRGPPARASQEDVIDV